MNLDGLGKSESTSMDVDDGAVSSRYPPCRDPVETDSPSGRMPSDLFHGYPSPRRECPPGVDGASALVTSSSSPVNYIGETDEVYRNYGLAQQHGDILPSLKPFESEVTQRKRKRTDDAPHPHIVEEEDGFTKDTHSLPPRRVRPRLQLRQDGDFSPLLVISPGREPPVDQGEDTALAFYYPQGVTNPSHTIRRRYFDPGPTRDHDHDPCILPRSSSPQLNDPEDRSERRRSDSTNSLAEVALASNVAPRHGRLSTLQDVGLPRPFEDTEQRFVESDAITVHERGLSAGPLFFSAKSGRAGGPPLVSESREPGGSSSSAMPALESSSIKFFDKPMCDSPDPIDLDEDESRRPWAT